MAWQPAVDMGGTFIKGALVGPGGELAAEHAVPTGAHDGPGAAVDNLVSLAAGLLDAAAQANGEPAPVIGIAVPGVVDVTRGVAVEATNIGWKNLPLERLLSERLGVPVALGHDVTVAGLAECRYGAGRGARPVLVVPIGTGIGAALVSDGRAYHGFHGSGIELGHVPLGWSDEPCPCGGVGCLERLASASAVAARYRRLNPSAGQVDAREVVRRLDGGDPAARSVWDDAVRALGDALTWAVRLFDPERIVLGGGLAKAGDTLLRPLAARLRASLTFQEAPPLAVSTLGSHAGVIGAAVFAQDRWTSTHAQVGRN